MRFCPLKAGAPEPAALAAEYREAKKADALRLGARHLFFRKNMKIYYISYGEIRRCFRRVLLVPVRASGGGEMQVENLVICDNERELAVILLRDPRMAASVMEDIKEMAPHAAFTKP